MEKHQKVKLRLVKHAAFERAAAFVSGIDACPAGTLDFIVGASGAGKSELSQTIGPRIYGSAYSNTAKPWIRVVARNPEAGYFSSKYMLTAIAGQLGDPFRGDRNFAAELPRDLEQLVYDTPSALRRTTEGTLSMAAERLSRAVQCRLLLVDEGNLISLTKRGRPPESHIENFRTLAQGMGVRIVFFGTLRLLGVIGYSAQVDRVSNVRLLDRFRNDSEAQISEFLSFLDSVESDLHLPAQFLTDHSTDLFEVTYGIPGQLRELLDSARRNWIADGAAQFAWRHVAEALPPPVIKARMREEADLVESVSNGYELTAEDVRRLKKMRLM